AVAQERDLAEQRGDLAVGRLAIQAAVLARLVLQVVRQLLALLGPDLIVGELGDLAPDLPQQLSQPTHHYAIDSPHDSCRKGDDPSKVAHGVLSDERCESTITHVLRKGAFLA